MHHFLWISFLRRLQLGVILLLLQGCSLCNPLQAVDAPDAGLKRVMDMNQPSRQEDMSQPVEPDAGGGGECVSTLSDDELCMQLDHRCGAAAVLDACGDLRQLRCDLCPPGSYCDLEADLGQCSPCKDLDFCATADAQCGVVMASAGSLMAQCGLRQVGCGECEEAGKACDEENRCVCPVETDEQMCGRLGKQCGRFEGLDGCGTMRMADCGQCQEGVCNQEMNLCSVCSTETNVQFCAKQGVDCGPTSGLDRCGDVNSVDCGGCPEDQTCDGGQCICPEPTCPVGACGQVSNECGKSTQCGGCPQQGDSCVNNGCACVPTSQAHLCAAGGLVCGTHDLVDHCGQTVRAACGECPAGKTCAPGGAACR